MATHYSYFANTKSVWKNFSFFLRVKDHRGTIGKGPIAWPFSSGTKAQKVMTVLSCLLIGAVVAAFPPAGLAALGVGGLVLAFAAGAVGWAVFPFLLSTVFLTINKTIRLLGGIISDVRNIRTTYQNNQRIKKNFFVRQSEMPLEVKPLFTFTNDTVTNSVVSEVAQSIAKVDKDQHEIAQGQEQIAKDQDKISKDQESITQEQMREERNPMGVRITPPAVSNDANADDDFSFEPFGGAPKAEPPTIDSTVDLPAPKVVDMPSAGVENATQMPEQQADLPRQPLENSTPSVSPPKESVLEYLARLERQNKAQIEAQANAKPDFFATKPKFAPPNPEDAPEPVVLPKKEAGVFTQLGDAIKNIKKWNVKNTPEADLPDSEINKDSSKKQPKK